MTPPNLIQIGNRIFNVNAIRHIEIEGPKVINVFLFEDNLPFQFVDDDAEALLIILNAGYVSTPDSVASGVSDPSKHEFN